MARQRRSTTFSQESTRPITQVALSARVSTLNNQDPEMQLAELREYAARKLLTNASYFAFTATPKNKTLEMFGEPLPRDVTLTPQGSQKFGDGLTVVKAGAMESLHEQVNVLQKRYRRSTAN